MPRKTIVTDTNDPFEIIFADPVEDDEQILPEKKSGTSFFYVNCRRSVYFVRQLYPISLIGSHATTV